MKFTSILIAFVATSSAINVATPKESYAAKAANLAEGLAVVAGQVSFEKNATTAHAAAMKKADEEAQAVKKAMRDARITALKTTFMKE
jgi:hypothetical protein